MYSRPASFVDNYVVCRYISKFTSLVLVKTGIEQSQPNLEKIQLVTSGYIIRKKYYHHQSWNNKYEQKEKKN